MSFGWRMRAFAVAGSLGLIATVLQFVVNVGKFTPAAKWALAGDAIVSALFLIDRLRTQRFRAASEPPGVIARTSDRTGALAARLGAAIDKLAEAVPEAAEMKPVIASLCANIEKRTVHIFIFGSQNAGKSLLAARLVGAELSPVMSCKCTACTVRIVQKSGDEVAYAHYRRGNRVERFAVRKLERRMLKWANTRERPFEVVIETPHAFALGPNVELVDTPGTGSAADEEGRNEEERSVASVIRLAAIAVVVYRPDEAQTAAQAGILRRLRDGNVETILLCNVDPNWVNELRTDRGRALSRLQSTQAAFRRLLPGATTLCLPLVDAIMTHAERTHARTDSIESLHAELQRRLEKRERYVTQEFAKSAHALIAPLETLATREISGGQTRYERAWRDHTAIRRVLADLRATLAKKNASREDRIAAGALFGTVAGAVASIALAFVIPVAGITLLAAAVGAGGGLAFDEVKQSTHRRELKAVLARLAAAVNGSPLATESVIRAVASASATLDDVSSARAATEAENATALDVDGRNEFRRYLASVKFKADVASLVSDIDELARTA